MDFRSWALGTNQAAQENTWPGSFSRDFWKGAKLMPMLSRCNRPESCGQIPRPYHVKRFSRYVQMRLPSVSSRGVTGPPRVQSHPSGLDKTGPEACLLLSWYCG
jgi:hypothetical protein